MTPWSRARAADVAVAAAFAASAAALFGEDRPWAVFVAWLAVHVLYGIVSGSLWSLVIVLTCPPLFVAAFKPDGYETPLWVEAAFVGAFYGVPFAFMGVLARRIWQLRRRELPPLPEREESAE